MRTLIVGSGPIGTFTGLMLARRGHDVLLVDRDAPPSSAAKWDRRGVMQYDLPHAFRWQVRDALQNETPELWTALLLAGGIPVAPPGMPEMMVGLQCRRSVLERTFWEFAAAEPNIARLTGRVDDLVVADGRVTGVVVEGRTINADLVVVATGRAGNIGDPLRAPAEGGPCGLSYAARQYRGRPGCHVPNEWGMPHREVHAGYETIVFPQDANTLTALFVRPTEDPLLFELRHDDAFQRVAAMVPALQPWTDPDSFEPITHVRSGSNLVNRYRGQADADGRITPGVIFIGDAVLTTNPAAGRGVPLGMQQARQFVNLLTELGDATDAATAFDAWCDDQLRPWFDDHREWDASELARFRGEPIDVESRIASDVIVECAKVDLSMMPVVGPYLGMFTGPRSLDAVQEKARALLRTGWRPQWAEGPTRDEIAAVVAAAAVS